MTQRVFQDKIVGIVTENNGRLEVHSCDRKNRVFSVDADSWNGAYTGDVVVLKPIGQGSNNQKYRVACVIGQENTPGILGLISLHEKGLSKTFSDASMKEAATMTVPELGNREDLRNVPLVTIDGPDSRDFDDAVFAEPTENGGFHLIVAIADVSWYVQPGSKLDEEAYERGNSTYLPDRVLPMLPEGISNDLCSLRPHEERACMAFHIWIDKDGQMNDYKVVRGLMRSAARLTYGQVQAAKDGTPDATTTPLMDTVINPLYAAYDVLREARFKRGAMELDMPEYKIAFGADGAVAGVKKMVRPDSTKVIEEFMVLANVAAATALESKNAGCVYRAHGAPPSAGRMSELREFLKGFGVNVPQGDLTAADLKQIVADTAGTPDARAIAKAVLRVQAKATYQTENIGHFGLALERYAHFTSPIRRYADLLVHRSLADAFNLGQGGLSAEQSANLSEMARHISETESISAKAERGANDRYIAEAMVNHIGEEMKGHIVGVSQSGLSIVLEETGAFGFLPTRLLPKDYYDINDATLTMTGRATGQVYRVDAEITVRVKEASGLKNNVILQVANDNKAQKPNAAKSPKSPRI